LVNAKKEITVSGGISNCRTQARSAYMRCGVVYQKMLNLKIEASVKEEVAFKLYESN
jgi:hypothetical protein